MSALGRISTPGSVTGQKRAGDQLGIAFEQLDAGLVSAVKSAAWLTTNIPVDTVCGSEATFCPSKNADTLASATKPVPEAKLDR